MADTTFSISTNNANNGESISVNAGGTITSGTINNNSATIVVPDGVITGASSTATIEIPSSGASVTMTLTEVANATNLTVSNLRVENITSSEAVMKFNINPVVDVAVEIDKGNGYETLPNTGEFASHNYSIHSVTALSPETSYTMRITPVGESSETVSFSTLVQSVSSGVFSAIPDNQWIVENSNDTSTLSSNWSSQNGFVSDGGSTDAWRVQVGQNDNYGGSRIWESMPTGTKELRFRYRVLFPSNYESFWKESDANMKMPGVTGPVSGANGGFGGSQNSSLAHDQRAWSLRQQTHRPHSSFTSLAMGMEVYWQGSSNPGTSDPFDNEFGDTEWYSSSGAISGALALNAGQWSEITIHVKMNDPGVANGEFFTFLNGEAGYSMTNFEWTKNTSFLNVTRLWMDTYHGGGSKGSSGTLSIFLRKFEVDIIS